MKVETQHILDDESIDLSVVDSIIERIGSGEEKLIPILQAIQDEFNYLPKEALQRMCELTNIAPENVAGVSTFYSQFRLKPCGKHVCRVCVGTACHVQNSSEIFSTLKRQLHIDAEHDTDAEHKFTVEEVACLGCCSLAPVVKIDEISYGELEPQDVRHVIKDFLHDHDKSTGVADQDVRSAGKSAGGIKICLCSSCRASGSDKVYSAIKAHFDRYKISANIIINVCSGQSFATPQLEIRDSRGKQFRYARVNEDDVDSVLVRHFQPTRLASRIKAKLFKGIENFVGDKNWEPPQRYSVDVRDPEVSPFEDKQLKITTESYSTLGPLRLDDYLSNHGFEALRKALDLKSQEIVKRVTDSGLRGRGGGGFSTGRKWVIVAACEADEKIVICNGDEGDPGAFMDRLLLESFPFRVLEGMIIASLAVGAQRGFVYVRAEYPLAVKRMASAIAQCEERGFLGENILDSGHNFRVEIFQGAGAFVCGEETALIESIEGRRGIPQYRPPYPAVKGLWDRPTLINNVETFASVPWILRNGADRFANIGVGDSKGTKTFSLAGKIKRGGLIEVPMGLTLHEIIHDIGGGSPNGKQIKAVQIGGPSGGCIPASLFDTPVDL